MAHASFACAIDQLVTNAMNRFDAAQSIGTGLELRAEAGDVVIDGAGGGEGSVTPDNIEKSFPRNDLAGAFRKQAKHGEFLSSEMKRLPIFRGGLADEIDLDLTETQAFRNLPAAIRSSQERANAGEQFFSAEGFDEVIVAARIEPGDPILDHALRGQEKNRHADGELPQLGADREAIDLRHHN